MDFTDEDGEITKGTAIFLGIVGGRADATMEKIAEDIMPLVLQELGRVPDRVILPFEGNSSIFICDWAERLHIPTQVYEAEWHRHQKRAKIFRDMRIQQESTHFLIFLNKRSEYNEKLAKRLVKSGKEVFTITYSDWSLERLFIERQQEPSLKRPSPRQVKRESKQDIGTMLRRQQSKQKGVLESQVQ